MRWTGFVLGGIAAAVVGIAGWQIWEAEQLKKPKWIDTERADCQAWDAYPQRNETVTWTGECRSGRAEGEGTLTWNYTDRTGEALTETASGRLVAGKWDGPTKMILPGDSHFEGMYRDGMKNGQGVYSWPDGRYDGEWKNDKQHGTGTYTDSEGRQHSGQWREGCLDEDDNIIALGNEMDACEELLEK
jgi:hypothetical protein